MMKHQYLVTQIIKNNNNNKNYYFDGTLSVAIVLREDPPRSLRSQAICDRIGVHSGSFYKSNT